jgi:hypothetical protein
MRTPEDHRVQSRAAAAVRRLPDINGGREHFSDCSSANEASRRNRTNMKTCLEARQTFLRDCCPPKAKATRSNRVGCATSVQNWARQNQPFLRLKRRPACAEALGQQTSCRLIAAVMPKFGRSPCVMFAKSTEGRTQELRRPCQLFAGRRQADGSRSGAGNVRC